MKPGTPIDRRMCLWNGLIAVTPGHPFMAKVIEMVVNNVRNRFTSVDVDQLLCPNPELSISHAFDTLFTAGPCILGAALNTVLGQHKQTPFKTGTLNMNDYNILSQWDGSKSIIPGEVVFLDQDKKDMGAHRFTFLEKNLVVAATDFPDFEDQPKGKKHYSKVHVKNGIYGLDLLYADQNKANEDIRLIIKQR